MQIGNNQILKTSLCAKLPVEGSTTLSIKLQIINCTLHNGIQLDHFFKELLLRKHCNSFHLFKCHILIFHKSIHSWNKLFVFSVCLRGIKAHRKCYLTVEEPKHYHDANEDCIAQGGTLATPRDMMENNELRDYAKRSAPGSRDFWIGVADIVKEGQYVDVNSLPVSFFNWDRSKKQPTGTKRESCVALSVAAQGKWYDEVCRNLKKYICEYVIPWRKQKDCW